MGTVVKDAVLLVLLKLGPCSPEAGDFAQGAGKLRHPRADWPIRRRTRSLVSNEAPWSIEPMIVSLRKRPVGHRRRIGYAGSGRGSG